MVLSSAAFFISVALLFFGSFFRNKNSCDTMEVLFPKSRTDAIRGVAAIGIVFSHIAAYSKASASFGILRYYNIFCTTLGVVGVNLFFFISGYGNVYSISRTNNRVKWLLKRCLSLLIVYLVCHAFVLGILYVGGYRTNLHSILNNLMHLTIDYSSVWYVKIQLLLYLFLTIASLMQKKSHKVILLTVLCIAASYCLYRLGYEDKWWKSTSCFAVGVAAAAYKDRIVLLINNKRKQLSIMCAALFPIAYIAGVLINIFPIMVIGNIVLCAVMMCLFEIAQFESRFYERAGFYSLELYLIHRSFVAWILSDGNTTNLKVAAIFAVSIAITVIVKWIDDRIIKMCFTKKRS